MHSADFQIGYGVRNMVVRQLHQIRKEVMSPEPLSIYQSKRVSERLAPRNEKLFPTSSSGEQET